MKRILLGLALFLAFPTFAQAACTDGTVLTVTSSASSCPGTAPYADGTSVQRVNTTMAADCTWSVAFAKSFISSTPIIHANPLISAGAAQPIVCEAIVRSATAASGKCFPGQATLLNLSIITTGLTLSPFSGTCTAGQAVMVVGAEPTQ